MSDCADGRGDPCDEAQARLAGLQVVAGRSRLSLNVERPWLVAADLELVLGEVQRLRKLQAEREQAVKHLTGALRNAVDNLGDDEMSALSTATQAKLADAFTWLERRLDGLGGG